MKKQYLNPMMTMVETDLQDILTASDGVLWNETGYGDIINW